MNQSSTCETEDLTLVAGRRRLRLRPKKGPKCIPVVDVGTVDEEFTINIVPKPAGTTFEDGRIRVMTSQPSSYKPASTLTFEGSNVGNQIVVSVGGTISDFNAVGSFDVVADGIGSLDPRVRIVRVRDFMLSRASQLQQTIDDYHFLVEAFEDFDLGTLNLSLDDALTQRFNETEASARAFIAEYGDE